MSDSGRSGEVRRQVAIVVVALGALAAVVVGHRYFGGPACEQTESSVRSRLDEDDAAEALKAIDAAPASCKARPSMRGRRAEALARAGRGAEAEAEANEALAGDPTEPFATYALAHAQHAAGGFEAARRNAEAAVQRGRGIPARLLWGILAYKTGDYTAARIAYHGILESRPNDIAATYNLALVEHQTNHYRDAREGYLKVLRLDPKHLDARFNLALLTHAAGAQLEAQHHLQKLRDAAPNDERVARLAAALAQPAATPALVLGAAPPSASANPASSAPR